MRAMTPKLKVTFRQLGYFIAVGETGSIARAAERISISPPSISTAISDLEREFNIQLFVRHHAQGLTLTPGGRRFFNEVKSLLAHADSLHETANDISGRVHGPINVGCLVTLSSYVIPELRRRFEENNPLVSYHHISANQVDLFEKLRRAEIDIAITYDLEMPADIAFEPLTELPPYALFAADHPLADRRSVSLQTLADLPLVLLDLPLSREYFLSLFHSQDLRPVIAERTPDMMMVRSLVANGLGYGLLNIPSLNRNAPDGKPLNYVALKTRLRPLALGLATMKSDKKARVLHAFEDHCRNVITDRAIPGMRPRPFA